MRIIKSYKQVCLVLFLMYLVSFHFAEVHAQAANSLFAGTGQSVSSAPNVAAMAQSAILEAKNAYDVSGGSSSVPKVAIVMENTGDGGTITNAIRTVYPSILVLGVENADQSYTPYTIKNIPTLDTDKSLSIMLLGGNAIGVKYATGIGDFASNNNAEAQKAGLDLASKLTPVPGVNSLILIMGQMHTPLNEYVVAGMKQIYGATLPQNLKIVGWSGSYWGGFIYDNGVLKTNQVIGIMMSGNFKWAFRGIDHGRLGWDGVSGPNGGDPVSAIGKQYTSIISELGQIPVASFMVIAHPDRSLFPAIRSTIFNSIGNSAMIGQHGGSETGHDTTQGNVIADAEHFFLVGMSPILNSTPTPATKSGDANNDSKVDGLDYVIWLTNYSTNQSGSSKGDFNNDSKIDGLDYVIWLTNYGK